MRAEGKPSVPTFPSDEEEFEFWETHDPEDYLTGETEPLEQILSPYPGELDEDVVVTLRLGTVAQFGDGGPHPLHFAAATCPDERDRDLGVVFERDMRPHLLDGYGVDYRRSATHCGASPGPSRELRIDLIVGDEGEAEHIAEALQEMLLRQGASPATKLSGRGLALTSTVAAWLRAHNAREIPAEEAQALLHP